MNMRIQEALKYNQIINNFTRYGDGDVYDDGYLDGDRYPDGYLDGDRYVDGYRDEF